MKCRCGFSFSNDALRRIRDGASSSGYAMIRDVDYERVMGMEQDYAAAESEDERLRAISKSSQFVGSVNKCPQCGLLVVASPISEVGEDEGPRFYREVD